MKILTSKHCYKSVNYIIVVVLHAGLLTLEIERAEHQNIPMNDVLNKTLLTNI